MSAQTSAVERFTPKAIAELASQPAFMQQLKMAIPHAGGTPERFVRILLTECRRVPKLLECNTQSLLGALMQCAQIGLEPGPMGLAYIIPYGGEAQFQLGYKGLLQLMWRSEQIRSVQSEVVYERDAFDYANGIPPRLEHKPASGDRGNPTHCYAVIETKAGGWIFRVMTAAEIDAHRDRYSKASNAHAAKKAAPSPWETNWDEMACKTLLKRTGKRAPISTEALTAIAADDRTEVGILDVDIEPVAQSPAEAAKAAVAAKADAQRAQGPAPMTAAEQAKIEARDRAEGSN